MDKSVKQAIFKRVKQEPFAQKFGLELVELKEGYSRVTMLLTGEMENIFEMPHGGAIFALIDEAFETACNSHGTVAVALSMSINYVAAASSGTKITAEAQEVSRTRRTATYDIKVRDGEDQLIATCQALAYRKGDPLPFLDHAKNDQEI